MANTQPTQYIRLYDIEPGKYDCFTVDEYESTYMDIFSKSFVDTLTKGELFLLSLLNSHYGRYHTICTSLGRKAIECLSIDSQSVIKLPDRKL